MSYSIDITLNDNDYLAFNKFVQFKSKRGKKQLLLYRILLTVIVLFSLLYSLITYGTPSVIIPYVILLIIVQASLIPFFTLILKAHIKQLQKKSKPLYSRNSHIDFSENAFTETTPDNKTQQNYSGVERVSVYNGYIFIHVNSILAYILPRSAFQSDEQFTGFIEFLKTKCNTVDIF